MKCPICGKAGNWYRYQKNPDGTYLDIWNGERWVVADDKLPEFEKKFSKQIRDFTYGTGEVFIIVHECGYAVEGTTFDDFAG